MDELKERARAIVARLTRWAKAGESGTPDPHNIYRQDADTIASLLARIEELEAERAQWVEPGRIG